MRKEALRPKIEAVGCIRKNFVAKKWLKFLPKIPASYEMVFNSRTKKAHEHQSIDFFAQVFQVNFL